MPRFFLDEPIDPAVAVQPRRKGYDALSIHESPHLGLPEADVLELAAARHRALVTYRIADLDALAVQWFARGQHHSGVVLVHERTIPQRTAAPLVRALARPADGSPGARSLDTQVL